MADWRDDRDEPSDYWSRREAREERRQRRRHRRSGHGGRRGERLRREETVYERAERRARQKVAWVRQAFAFGVVMLVLMILSRGPGLVVALILGLTWGVTLAMRAFSLFVADGLRDRWVAQEVDEQVRQQVSLQRRAMEAERTRSMEELSASIAHEIRNPITAAKSLVQQMGEDPASSENVEYAAVALEELERVERSVAHLLRYGREESLKRQPVELSAVVEDALTLLAERIQSLGVEVIRDFDEVGTLSADYDMLRRLFLNLIGNALDAFEEVRRVADSHESAQHPTLSISLGESLARTEVWVRVADNGPGMDAETREQVFRPFFTSKERGTGLGLALARKLVEAHDGQIELHSAPGEGTEFLITLPRRAGGERS